MNPHEQSGLCQLAELVDQNYVQLPPIAISDSMDPADFYLSSPNRTAYARCWVLASAIVNAKYIQCGVDVLPVFHPENGWDRFLITRRVTGETFAYQPANEFGMLMLDAEDAPVYTSPGGKTRVKIGDRLTAEFDDVEREILEYVDAPLIDAGSNKLMTHEQAEKYPMLLRAVVELIAEFPGLIAAREIFIDDEEIDGQYHPLFLHAAELTGMGPDDRYGANVATTTYRWFQLQYGDQFAFFDKRGTRSVYRTDRGTWSRVRSQLADEPTLEGCKARIKGWLRLDGCSPDESID